MGYYKDTMYGFWSEPEEDTGPDVHECSFPDTDTRISWCRICDCDAEFNFELGKYIAVN